MKITLNWLKQYVEIPWTPEELAERLTMLGLEVEAVQKLGGEFDGIVVAQILASEKHPNADKLSVCRVADGRGERQIVCGAKNYAVGEKVPLIVPEHTLPARPGESPVTIRAGKIRGVQSEGMLCSPKELGLAEDAQGLMILPADAKVGQPFAEYLGRTAGDVLYDLEITPNRSDLNSVIGIAREVSALSGKPLRVPEVRLPASAAGSTQPPVESLVAVRLDAPELCPRYVARIVRGVKIGPSPAWLGATLEKVGIRSINNVVDVTNYVMMEVGQPLHAFDFHLLTAAPGAAALPTIVVRRALDGERFVTLDGQAHTLSSQMLLIADETKAVALAGIMGGQNTEINPNTVDVLIEAACFKPQNIRATSKKLDVRTDASYRFERGADLGGTDWANRRAAQLILETAGGEPAPGVVDAYPKPAVPVKITLRHVKVRELLGVEVPVRDQIDYLKRLELTVTGPEHGSFNTFSVPTFRVDLKRETDLIEEIGRLYGVDRIPGTPPRGAIGSNPYDFVHDELAEARRILTGLGLCEAQGQTLISEGAAKACATETGATPLRLANPLSGDMNLLRPSLLPGLIEALRHNIHHKNCDVALFELGRVFIQKGNATGEDRRMAIALTGHRHPLFWSGEDRQALYDIYDLKGLLQEFFDQFGVRGMNYLRESEGAGCYLESASIQLGRHTLGEFGQLSPQLAKGYDLREPVLIAELNLDLLLARRNTTKSYKPLPLFPSIQRDVAMLLPESTLHEAVLAAVAEAKAPNLDKTELFDVYRGKNVPPGQKSVAYSFTYRSAERTLTDAEVNAAHQRVVEQLKKTLHAVIRE